MNDAVALRFHERNHDRSCDSIGWVFETRKLYKRGRRWVLSRNKISRLLSSNVKFGSNGEALGTLARNLHQIWLREEGPHSREWPYYSTSEQESMRLSSPQRNLQTSGNQYRCTTSLESTTNNSVLWGWPGGTKRNAEASTTRKLFAPITFALEFTMATGFALLYMAFVAKM